MGQVDLRGVMRCGGTGTLRVSTWWAFSGCFMGVKSGRPSSSMVISVVVDLGPVGAARGGRESVVFGVEDVSIMISSSCPVKRKA